MPSAPSSRLGLTSPLTTEAAAGPANIATLITQLEASVGMVKIAEVSAGGGGSVTFSSIPQVFSHLLIEGYARSTYAVADTNRPSLRVRFNGDSVGPYDSRTVDWAGASGGAVSVVASAGQTSLSAGAILDEKTGVLPTYSACRLEVPGYAVASRDKHLMGRVVTPVPPGGTGLPELVDSAGIWRLASSLGAGAAITSIALFANFGSLASESTFSLYGLR